MWREKDEDGKRVLLTFFTPFVVAIHLLCIWLNECIKEREEDEAEITVINIKFNASTTETRRLSLHHIIELYGYERIEEEEEKEKKKASKKLCGKIFYRFSWVLQDHYSSFYFHVYAYFVFSSFRWKVYSFPVYVCEWL